MKQVRIFLDLNLRLQKIKGRERDIFIFFLSFLNVFLYVFFFYNFLLMKYVRKIVLRNNAKRKTTSDAQSSCLPTSGFNCQCPRAAKKKSYGRYRIHNPLFPGPVIQVQLTFSILQKTKFIFRTLFLFLSISLFHTLNICSYITAGCPYFFFFLYNISNGHNCYPIFEYESFHDG